MPAPNLDGLAWRKSSFSGSGGNSSGCVEVAPLPGGGVAVRDTKDRTRAPHRHSAPAWQEFIAGVRAGDFEPTVQSGYRMPSDGLAWRKSSFSGSGGASSGCVEVAALPEGGMAVRDTKDRSRSAHRHSAAAWRQFLAGVRAGEFGPAA